MNDTQSLIGLFDTPGELFGPTIALTTVAGANLYRSGLIFAYKTVGAPPNDELQITPVITLANPPRLTINRENTPIILAFSEWGPWVTLEWTVSTITADEELSVFELIWFPQRYGGK